MVNGLYTLSKSPDDERLRLVLSQWDKESRVSWIHEFTTIFYTMTYLFWFDTLVLWHCLTIVTASVNWVILAIWLMCDTYTQQIKWESNGLDVYCLVIYLTTGL